MSISPALYVVWACAAPLAAQVTFSIDYGGPTNGFPDSLLGTPITEGDILAPNGGTPALGPLGRPGLSISGGAGGLGLALYPLGPIEVDALSYGQDGPAFPVPVMNITMQWRWSVDEFVMGIGVPAAPNVDSEGDLGAREASADVFIPSVTLPGPQPPGATPGDNVGTLDGNGFIGPSGFGYPGVGLIDWNPPGPPPDLGDNIDALNVDGPADPPVVYFSLSSAFTDPLLGVANSGAAVAHGFRGGDVLRKVGAAPPELYAQAMLLGLDSGGVDTDDLDALIIRENGMPGYQPSMMPYDWLGPGGKDLLLFSVRRGSALVMSTTQDAFYGTPIEEGDILYPVPGGPPGIWYAAENLGMNTNRSSGVLYGDDLDGLDLTNEPTIDCNGDGFEDAWNIAFGGAQDCNKNGLIDSCEIAAGTSSDIDGNGVPDECECGAVGTYCTAKVNSLSCIPIIWSKGTPCASCPTPFTIDAVDIVSFKNGLLFYGLGTASIDFMGGTLCVMPPLKRTSLMNSAGVPPSTCSGSYMFDMQAEISISPLLPPGSTAYAQYWYRDPSIGDGTGVGLTNATMFTVCP